MKIEIVHNISSRNYRIRRRTTWFERLSFQPKYLFLSFSEQEFKWALSGSSFDNVADTQVFLQRFVKDVYKDINEWKAIYVFEFNGGRLQEQR
jgi:hypothetical protein